MKNSFLSFICSSSMYNVQYSLFRKVENSIYLSCQPHIKNKQNLKQETGETLGETVETPEEIVETLGEACGNTMGNGRKWLGK